MFQSKGFIGKFQCHYSVGSFSLNMSISNLDICDKCVEKDSENLCTLIYVP